MTHVVAELRFDPPLTREGLAAIRETAGWRCVAADKVRLQKTYLAESGRIAVCHFEAPDAESVRIALRRAGIGFERVWTARVL